MYVLIFKLHHDCLSRKKMRARNYPLHDTLEPTFSFVCDANLKFPLGLQFLVLRREDAIGEDLLCQKNTSTR